MLLGFYNYLVFYCGMSVVIIKNDDDADDDDRKIDISQQRIDGSDEV